VNKASLLVTLEAKPGREKDLEQLLVSGEAIVRQQEPATRAWFAFRLGPTTFGIFDVFPDAKGRQAHLDGPLAAALMAKAPELLASPPAIRPADVLAEKL
jgi:quinol monooxygenase YgiN